MGQHVEASLAQTATFHQGIYFQEYRKVWDEPRGWDALGDGPNQRFYRVRDGWVFIGFKRTEGTPVSYTHLTLPTILRV